MLRVPDFRAHCCCPISIKSPRFSSIGNALTHSKSHIYFRIIVAPLSKMRAFSKTGFEEKACRVQAGLGRVWNMPGFNGVLPMIINH
jgi:hypothetical protein